MLIFKETRNKLVTYRIATEQFTCRRKVIDLFVGSHPPMAVSRHNNIVHPFVIHLHYPMDGIVSLVKHIGPVKCPNYDVSS